MLRLLRLKGIQTLSQSTPGAVALLLNSRFICSRPRRPLLTCAMYVQYEGEQVRLSKSSKNANQDYRYRRQRQRQRPSCHEAAE